MKIAVFHELPVGGARRAVNEIGYRLKKNNMVDLYVVDEKKNLEERKFFSNMYFYQFIPRRWAGRDWKTRIYKDTLELFMLYLLHKKIANTIKERKYDVLIVNASKFIEAPFILQFRNAKKIFYCHDPYYRLVYEDYLTFPKDLDLIRKLYEKINRFMRKTLDRQNLYGADFIFANSCYTQEKIREIYRKESTVVYLGVDEKFFRPANLKKEYDLLFIGSKQPLDGYDFLKEALRSLHPKPKIRIVLSNKAWLNDFRIRDIYRSSKIVLCLARNEPFGLIPLEAGSCGTPVVAVDEGGYSESIINRKTGFLVKRDPKELADTIAKLLVDKKLRDDMGKEARLEIKKNWTWEKSVANFFGAIEKCIKM